MTPVYFVGQHRTFNFNFSQLDWCGRSINSGRWAYFCCSQSRDYLSSVYMSTVVPNIGCECHLDAPLLKLCKHIQSGACPVKWETLVPSEPKRYSEVDFLPNNFCKSQKKPQIAEERPAKQFTTWDTCAFDLQPHEAGQSAHTHRYTHPYTPCVCVCYA